MRHYTLAGVRPPGLSMLGMGLVLGLATVTRAAYVVPGGRWFDTDGALVNAHAGSVSFDEATGKFWLFGEYKIEGQTEGAGVSVYSSDDLATWTSHGLALGETAPSPPLFTFALYVVAYVCVLGVVLCSSQIHFLFGSLGHYAIRDVVQQKGCKISLVQ